MEINQDVVIVGGGIAGLTTALGLHRLGLKSLVLESSEKLRVSGFALTLWTNAWRALDAVGVANSLRQHYPTLPRFRVASSVSGLSSELYPDSKGGDNKDYEIRCVRRKELLETLEGELPHGTIRYSSKVVSIEDSGFHKLLHLADGSTVRAKVVIGCDGVNSPVGKWLGFQKPVDSGRAAIRGLVEYPDGHSFQLRFHVFFGGGVRFGFLPCGYNSIYWFCTINSSLQRDIEDMEENPLRMKQFVLRKISKIPKEAADLVEKAEDLVERTKLDCISCSSLKFRLPWHVLLGNITKSNVCVAGDALHPMTPDIGQGGCSALEDAVVLARCLGEALLARPQKEEEEEEQHEEYERIKKGLEKYAKERRWRSFRLISTAFLVGFVQENNSRVMTFLREKLLSELSVGAMWKMADYDCGDLYHS